MKDYYGREYALICDVLTMLGDELRKPQNYAHKENQVSRIKVSIANIFF